MGLATRPGGARRSPVRRRNSPRSTAGRRAGPGRPQPGAHLIITTDLVEGRPVRSLSTGQLSGIPEIVMVPGLGAPGYLIPWASALGRSTRVTIVDLPGWRFGRARSSRPTVADVGVATVAWLRAAGRTRGVVLVGHSSGAQAAIRTATAAPELLTGLVLGGPTFDPAVRRLSALARRAVPTLLHESPAEVPAVLPSYLHSGGALILRYLRSALEDRPEDAVRGLRVPVLVATGEHDHFAPPEWAQRLAEIAGGRCAVLPGAHNFCFTHPEAAAAAVLEAAENWSGTADAARAT